ncbi:CDP-glycerol glycerophosphotransferase family protein [Campylobacter sputorum]|uniref:CDP-glycerol glycerophosphotransferase family protein n=1 Tax=Campylobacter sputorum TaxID=206 RepID=UPI00053BFFD7|nr:CDP-glycerol glycerophosphotransferase family protein [Campylobacter sputorum]
MDLSYLSGKKIYIYPLSNTSITFSHYAQLENAKILGFIDAKKKYYANIQSIQLDEAKDYDFIVIYSPNHDKEIYDFCMSKISKDKILCAQLVKMKDYVLKKEPSKQKSRFEELNTILEKRKEKPYKLRDEILLIGMQFIDLNLKYLYFYLLEHSKFKIHLATYNKSDYELYKNAGFDIVWCDSDEFIDLIFSSKIKIIDQTPIIPFFLNVLKIGKAIQLYHGITIEKLGILADYKVIKYALVLSTSKFVSDYSFSKIYLYDKIIECGYPRNDILRGYESKIFNVDEQILAEVEQAKYKFVIYAPTHRAYGFDINPLDYQKLNNFGAKNGIKFIIKMHPYIAIKLCDDLNLHKANGVNFDHIIIYPAQKDAYAVMKYCDLMVADYSSMYFDFLFVDKPIVFFPYDYDEWIESEGGTCLDYFAYSPGDKAYNQNELENFILENLSNDKYKNQRDDIKKLMFDNLEFSSCKLIKEEIEKIL